MVMVHQDIPWPLLTAGQITRDVPHLPALILFQNHLPKSLQRKSIVTGSPENPLYLHVLQHPRFYLPKHKRHGLMVKFCVLLWLASEKHLLCVISIHTCHRQDCGKILASVIFVSNYSEIKKNTFTNHLSRLNSTTACDFITVCKNP